MWDLRGSVELHSSVIVPLSITLCCFCRTVAIQHKAAFSVARGTNEYPDKSSVIRFTNVITNLNDDYNTETGRFRCEATSYVIMLEKHVIVLVRVRIFVILVEVKLDYFRWQAEIIQTTDVKQLLV